MHCFVNNKRIQLSYETFGTEGCPAIVLIQGLGTQMIGWPESLCLGLAEQGYFVVRFDNRDVGQSSSMAALGNPSLIRVAIKQALGMKVYAPYRMQDMANDCIDLLDALNIDVAHIVGVSMGGMIAQWVAILYPERVLSLVAMMSSSSYKGLPGPKLKVRHAMLGRANPNNREACINHGMKVWQALAGSGYPADTDALRKLVNDSYERGYNPSGVVRQLCAIIADTERHSHLGMIKVKTLVVHGSDDPMLPLKNGEDLCRCIRGAELIIIDGLGHDFPCSVIPRFISLINEHILSIA